MITLLTRFWLSSEDEELDSSPLSGIRVVVNSLPGWTFKICSGITVFPVTLYSIRLFFLLFLWRIEESAPVLIVCKSSLTGLPPSPFWIEYTVLFIETSVSHVFILEIVGLIESLHQISCKDDSGVWRDHSEHENAVFVQVLRHELCHVGVLSSVVSLREVLECAECQMLFDEPFRETRKHEHSEPLHEWNGRGEQQNEIPDKNRIYGSTQAIWWIFKKN